MQMIGRHSRMIEHKSMIGQMHQDAATKMRINGKYINIVPIIWVRDHKLLDSKQSIVQLLRRMIAIKQLTAKSLPSTLEKTHSTHSFYPFFNVFALI